MKYRIEISEEQLRIIGLAVDEYMRVRMGQFEDLASELTFDGYRCQLGCNAQLSSYGLPHFVKDTSERVEHLFKKAYEEAYYPKGYRERQHDSWGTCIDLMHAIEHQQWLDAPKDKREKPCTTNRSFKPVPLGHEPFPKIARVDE